MVGKGPILGGAHQNAWTLWNQREIKRAMHQTIRAAWDTQLLGICESYKSDPGLNSFKYAQEAHPEFDWGSQCLCGWEHFSAKKYGSFAHFEIGHMVKAPFHEKFPLLSPDQQACVEGRRRSSGVRAPLSCLRKPEVHGTRNGRPRVRLRSFELEARLYLAGYWCVR